LAYLML